MNAAELTTAVTRLEERTDSQKEQINRLDAELRSTGDKLDKLVTENALLKREIDELKKHKDLWSNRLFVLIIAILGPIVGAVIAYLARR